MFIDLKYLILLKRDMQTRSETQSPNKPKRPCPKILVSKGHVVSLTEMKLQSKNKSFAQEEITNRADLSGQGHLVEDVEIFLPVKFR